MISIFRICCVFCVFLAHTICNAQSTEIGKASYYNNSFQGKQTASGELYDKSKYTAAHPTLDFNTKVMVTNLNNNKSVVVVINDRGPYEKNRIIDLSRAAAREIGLIDKGILKVKIEVLENYALYFSNYYLKDQK
ncbi:septal ring lytic transglycosylase RlpA family protein [uncultured Formosa sp.]|uniref:septal ring lytic transglycosylase RlpA family protein n=1 Tax=uncultured Formosa sp. TaxID=255435 RepID=UPI00261ABB7A|nr:septal ring lytic transglycosylase RlpA family protein [uncultured Formosa sp.]